MKYWVIFGAFLCACSFVSAQVTITDEKVEVIFNSKLSMQDLERIQAEMTAQNIDLHYESLAFTKKGKLKHISFEVDFNDGNSGSAYTGAIGLKRRSRFGFRKYYADNAPYSCIIGSIGKQ